MGEHHLARLAEKAFERHGDYESLFFEGAWHRTGELFDRSRRLAGGLIELGIEPGDRVVLMMANTPDVGVTYTALWRAGWRTIDTTTLAADLAAGKRPPPRSFVISFDDGYVDGFTEAYPILAHLDLVEVWGAGRPAP